VSENTSSRNSLGLNVRGRPSFGTERMAPWWTRPQEVFGSTDDLTEQGRTQLVPWRAAKFNALSVVSLAVLTHLVQILHCGLVSSCNLRDDLGSLVREMASTPAHDEGVCVLARGVHL